MVFHESNVRVNKVEEMGIPYSTTGEYIVLMLKGILDSGSESTVAEKSKFGRIVQDKGQKTSICSVLNSDKKYFTRATMHKECINLPFSVLPV